MLSFFLSFQFLNHVRPYNVCLYVLKNIMSTTDGCKECTVIACLDDLIDDLGLPTREEAAAYRALHPHDVLATEGPPLEGDVSWSQQDAPALRRLILAEGGKHAWDRRRLRAYFSSLALIDRGITTLVATTTSPDTTGVAAAATTATASADNNNNNNKNKKELIEALVNLRQLSLTGNTIPCSKLVGAFFPRQLEVLHLCACDLADAATLGATLSSGAPPGLQHLGLSHNNLQLPPPMPTQSWSNLISLDLAWNSLDAKALLPLAQIAANLPSLCSLVATGNPLCLLPQYRAIVVDAAPQLLVLDDIDITYAERLDCAGAHSRAVAASLAAAATVSDYTEELFQNVSMTADAVIELHLGALENLPRPPTLGVIVEDKLATKNSDSAEEETAEPEVVRSYGYYLEFELPGTRPIALTGSTPQLSTTLTNKNTATATTATTTTTTTTTITTSGSDISEATTKADATNLSLPIPPQHPIPVPMNSTRPGIYRTHSGAWCVSLALTGASFALQCTDVTTVRNALAEGLTVRVYEVVSDGILPRPLTPPAGNPAQNEQGKAGKKSSSKRRGSVSSSAVAKTSKVDKKKKKEKKREAPAPAFVATAAACERQWLPVLTRELGRAPVPASIELLEPTAAGDANVRVPFTSTLVQQTTTTTEEDADAFSTDDSGVVLTGLPAEYYILEAKQAEAAAAAAERARLEEIEKAAKRNKRGRTQQPKSLPPSSVKSKRATTSKKSSKVTTESTGGSASATQTEIIMAPSMPLVPTTRIDPVPVRLSGLLVLRR